MTTFTAETAGNRHSPRHQRETTDANQGPKPTTVSEGAELVVQLSRRLGRSRSVGVNHVTKYRMLDLHRLLELAGLVEDLPTTRENTHQEALRSFARDGQPVLHGDDACTAWLKLLGIYEGGSRPDPQLQRLVALAGIYHLYEVGVQTLDKLRTLRDHPNTSPEERAAAIAAIDRIQPPRPPPPKVPDGGYANRGKVFSAGADDTPKPSPSYRTARGKTFA